MFGQQKIVLGNVTVVVVGNSNIQQNIQQHRKIEQCKIKAVTLVSNSILNGSVNPKNPERLDQQVQKEQ